jgi:hypothetical protein
LIQKSLMIQKNLNFLKNLMYLLFQKSLDLLKIH